MRAVPRRGRARANLAPGLLLAAGLIACRAGGGDDTVWTEYRSADARLDETSGLAASGRRPDVVFAINDSGAPPHLHAMTPAGRLLQRFRLRGAENRDWEALAGFTAAGRAWLLVGDIGDNDARHLALDLYLLPEPEVSAGAAPATLETRRFTVRIPDGPRDFESLLVVPGDPEATHAGADDTGDRVTVLLLSKRDVLPRLYTVPLPLGGAKTALTARQRGEVRSLIRPTAAEMRRADRRGRWSAQPTDLAIDPGGRQVALLTYKRLYLYHLAAPDDWERVFRRAVRVIDLPPIEQAEGLTFLGSACLLIGSEGMPAPLLHLELAAGGCRLHPAAPPPNQ